ncbi:MAG TPA: SAM-dependent methyltransferase [Acidiferrobacterales bacterium]|nr:SAM-dependent methyltransferase [Acidiferrobacterales bacterium]
MSRIPNAPALPEPTPEERALSQRLTDLMRAEIARAGGAIPFARFMELALYAPELGYYSAGKHKFGAAGDFVTAPELGPVFAQCLARQCAQILGALPQGDILEAGAGSGALAVQLLLELERLGQLPAHYLILEISSALRARQRALFTEQAPHLLTRIQWLDKLPSTGFRGIVLGNELLDAMPAERFHFDAKGIAQLLVGWQENRFVWREAPANAALRDRVAALGLPEGYISEIGFAAEGWVRSVADILEQGVLLLVDYGFPGHEFYHPQRAGGTLMCHYRHRAHDDPLLFVGLQDITAHVDFTAIARAGTEAGLSLLGYTSQALFLLGCGLDAIAARIDPADARAHLQFTNEVKKLTLPHEMGELFKVIAFGRGSDAPLTGFRLQDRRGRL